MVDAIRAWAKEAEKNILPQIGGTGVTNFDPAVKKDGTPVPLIFRKNKKEPPVCTVCHKDVGGPLICQTVPCDTLTPLNPD